MQVIFSCKNRILVLPSGRYITPAGSTIQIAHDPFGIAPDYTPYQLKFPSKEVFDPELALQKFHRYGDCKKIIKGDDMYEEDDQRIKHAQQH